MSLRMLIKGTTDFLAEVVKPSKNELPGLVTYNTPLTPQEFEFVRATSPLFGTDLNQQIEFSGTPEPVHNGIDSVEWTGSILTGGGGAFDFNSGVQANSGSFSVNASGSNNGNEALFTAPSVVDFGNFVALSGFIYITAFSTSGVKDIEFRFRLAGADVGNSVLLSNFIDTTSFNVWQQWALRKSDFEITDANIDELVVQTISTGGGAAPDYFLDDMQIEESGGAEAFIIAPDKGLVFNIERIELNFVDAFDSTLLDASMPRIPTIGILNETSLPIGLIIRSSKDMITQFNTVIKDFQDFLDVPMVMDIVTGGDAENTWLKVRYSFVKPLLLDDAQGDNIEIIVNDDLSGLDKFTVTANGFNSPIRGEVLI